MRAADAVKRFAAVVVAIVSVEAAAQESAPNLRLLVDGAADPSSVRVEYMLVGQFGGYRSQLRGTADHIDIPTIVDGQAARSLKALVFCPGYGTVRVEIPDVAAHAAGLRVVLDPLPVRSLTGTVQFVSGASPKSFVLDIDAMIYSSHQFFGISDGAVTAFDVSETVVSAEGDFSLVIPDLREDETLQSASPRTSFRFSAGDATTRNVVFDLIPREVAIEDVPQTLILTASPRL